MRWLFASALVAWAAGSAAVSPVPFFVGGVSAGANLLIWKLDSSANDDIASAVSVGSGQVTVTRAGANIKTRVDSSGFIDELAANTLLRNFRWNGLAFEQDGWQPEETSTNVCLQSENFGSVWLPSNLPTRSAGAITSGDLAFDLITDDSAILPEGYTQVITFTGNAVKAISIFIGQGTSTSTLIRLRDTTAAANRLNVAVTWSGGAPSVSAATGTYLGSIRVATTGGPGVAYRLLFATTSVTAANVNSLEVYAASDTAADGGPQGNVYLGGAQAENRTRPSSYIPTAGGTVTRPIDAVTRTTAGIPGFNATAGMIYFKGRSAFGSVPAGIYPVAVSVSGGLNEQVTWFKSGDDQKLYTQILDGGAGVMFNDHGVEAGDTVMKGALIWAANNSASVKDGVTPLTDASVTLPTMTTVSIGGFEGGVHDWNGTIHEVEIYAGRPTNGFAQDLTALFAPLLPSQMSDNGYSTDSGDYYEQSSLSRLLVSTDATSVQVEFYVDQTSYDLFASTMGVGVWDGTTRQYVTPTSSGFNVQTVTLAAGTKTVEITSGAQNHYGGPVLGNRLTAVRFNGHTFTTLVEGTRTPRIVVYGDSIAAGLMSSEPPNNSWAAKLRQLSSSRSVMLEAWGSRTMKSDAETSGMRQTFADLIESYEPSTIWLAIGFNDWNQSAWNAADFGVAYADLLDKLHAENPSAAIYAQSPIDAVVETANFYGNTLGDYRTQIQTVCAARGWCNFSDGTAYLAAPGDLDADGVHPNTTGHNLIYLAVKAELGL